MTQGLIVVVSGPSGVGKGTVVASSGIPIATSLTSRSPKDRDMPGEYQYVSEEAFRHAIDSGLLLEFDNHFGNWYGLLAPKLGQTVITDIDVHGAIAIMPRDDVLCIGLLPPPPPLETLRQRLAGRGDDTLEEIETRLARVEEELTLIDAHWQHKVVALNKVYTVREVLRIVRAHKKNVS